MAIRICQVRMLRQPRSSLYFNDRRGFTLIELLAVVAILGMFAAMATLSLQGAITASRQQLEWQQLISMDATLRAQCRRLRQPATLRVNVQEGVWVRHLSGMPPLQMAQISRSRAISSHGQAAQSGEVTLSYRADGSSDSFAVQWVGDDENRWRLVCGGTGQWIEGVSHDAVRTLQTQ